MTNDPTVRRKLAKSEGGGSAQLLADLFLPAFLSIPFQTLNQLIINKVEARGVEPLSLKLSARPSTCLYGF